MSYDALLHKIYGKAFDIKLFVIFFFNGIPNALNTCTIVMLLYSPPNQRCNLPYYALDAVEKIRQQICFYDHGCVFFQFFYIDFETKWMDCVVQAHGLLGIKN